MFGSGQKLGKAKTMPFRVTASLVEHLSRDYAWVESLNEYHTSKL